MRFSSSLASGIVGLALLASVGQVATGNAQPPKQTSETSKTETTSEVVVERKLTGLMGVKWGDSVATARKTLTQAGLKVDETLSDNTRLFVVKTKMGGISVSRVGFIFGGEGCYHIFAIFEKVAPDNTFDTFDEVHDLVAKKYGKASSDLRTHDSPYSQGDGKDLEALQAGKSYVASVWYLDKPDEQKKANSMILMKLSKELFLTLNYYDVVRTDRAEEESSKQKSKDF